MSALSRYQHRLREYAFRLLVKSPPSVRALAARTFVRRRTRQLEALRTPAMLILYVTNRCNARCAHCFYWKEVERGERSELALEEIERIARSLESPLATISLTGGEPFLRADLADICRAFHERNGARKIAIATNGFSPSRIAGAAREIVRACPADVSIKVSLDGLRETHDRVRGVPLFEKAVETVAALEGVAREAPSFHVSILTTISRENLRDLGDLRRFTESRFPRVHHGYHFVRSAARDVYNIDRTILSDCDPEEGGSLLSVEEMEEALRRLDAFSDGGDSLLGAYGRVMHRGIIDMKRRERSFVRCLAGRYDGVIWPDGRVSMCEFTRPFADLRAFDFDFHALWTGPEAESIRRKIRACFCTHTCNLLNSMQFDERALRRVLSV